MLQYLFSTADAHRLIAFCDARNAPVASLLNRVGMRQESRQIEADWFKGEWTTLDGYAILAENTRGLPDVMGKDSGGPLKRQAALRAFAAIASSWEISPPRQRRWV